MGIVFGITIFYFIYGYDTLIVSIKSFNILALVSFIFLYSIKYLVSNSNWRFIKEILLHNRILKDKNIDLDVRIASREDSIKKLYNLKSEIMNNFSHEIRTPLHATGNYMDVAIIRSEDEGYKKEDVGELVKKAKESFDGLKKYILRLSDLSEFQTKKMLFQMTRYDLMDILQNLKDEYHGIVDIHLYCRKDSGTVMMCDVIKIKSVFKELIENSITHAKANFIEVRVRPKEDRIDVVYSEMPGKNFKSIISEDKLFEPFEVLRDSSEGYKGLGLALVKEIMIRHHGSIEGKWEEIEYGFDVPGYAPKRQLIFSLTFDKKRYIPSDGANYEDHQLNKSSKIKFLLVDDDTTILKSTSLMLESQGYEVFCAEGGEAAIDFIASEVEDIQFVLLDIMMPDKDGFQVLDSVWDIIQKRNIKVIIQSGAAIATDYASYMKKYESLTFCSKPYSLAELKQSILLASEDKKTKNIL
jgi:signal transduction histidine kinase/ActR/RegA family two-component response regulator